MPMQTHPINRGHNGWGRSARMRLASATAVSDKLRQGRRKTRPSGPIVRGTEAPAHTYRSAAHTPHFAMVS